MPFVTVDQPTMGVSILKNALNKAGIKTDVHYPCLPLSISIPKGMYDWLGSNVYDRIGDYFFSEILFGYDSKREQILINSLNELEYNQRFPTIDNIKNVRELVDYLPILRSLVKKLFEE